MSRQAARPSARQSNFVLSSRKIVGAFLVPPASLDTNRTFHEIKSQEQCKINNDIDGNSSCLCVCVCFSSGNVCCAVDAYLPSVVLIVIVLTITISIIINIFFFLTVII